ncbi:MAG: hypothetical protein ACFE7E_06255 [Candidatus Hodarchaeota archaeon]
MMEGQAISRNEKARDERIEEALAEVKSAIQESKDMLEIVKSALETLGLKLIDRFSGMEGLLEETREALSKLENIEITLRGLRFTFTDTLKKFAERFSELESSVKKATTIPVEKPEEVEAKTQLKMEVPAEATDASPAATATEEVLSKLSRDAKSGMSAERLSKKIVESRDMIMSWSPYHPTLWDMHEWSLRVKQSPSNKPIDATMLNKLLIKINEWKARLLRSEQIEET